MALCIVDTDKTATNAPLKDTATSVLQHRESLHTAGLVADAHPLPCHELENLLPARLILDAAPTGQDGDLARHHQAALGLVDYVDLKRLICKHLLAWVTDRPPTAKKLAEYCFAADSHPYLKELGALLWSWGLAPPGGKARV